LFAVAVFGGQGLAFEWKTPSVQAYADVFVGYRLEIISRTVLVVSAVTLLELILAFPFALWLAKGMKGGWLRELILVLLVVPFFLSAASRTVVWLSVLGREGLVNRLLIGSGIINEPVSWLLYSTFSVYLGLIGPYFPSMVWPIFIAVSLIDGSLLQASRDLGAGGSQTLRHVVLPLAAPGILAGMVFTAAPMLGDNVVSSLLGGGRIALIAESFDDMIGAMNYRGAAALASILVLSILLMGLAAFFGLQRLIGAARHV
jgi:ABC-type spermidine/putrescine transport system permease subunit I